jgi:hypothetical protein
MLWVIAGLFLVGLSGYRPAGVDVFPGASGESAAVVQEHAESAEEHAGSGEHSTARFFLILIAILVVGKLSGELAERIRQPAVLGELVGGVIVGGSVLGIVPTAAGDPMAETIHLFAEIGVVILLFEVGLETDLKEMFRVGPAAAAVAAIGVIVPFALGAGYWYFADPALGAKPEGVSLAKIAIFVGATLTATSVGITEESGGAYDHRRGGDRRRLGTRHAGPRRRAGSRHHHDLWHRNLGAGQSGGLPGGRRGHWELHRAASF